MLYGVNNAPIASLPTSRSLISPPVLCEIVTSLFAVTPASTFVKPAALIAAAIVLASELEPELVNVTFTAAFNASCP